MHAQRISARVAGRLTTAHACLGRAIRDLRTQRGITEAQLARAIHAHPAYVDALERGDINPPFHVLLGLTHGLRTTLPELFALHQRHIESYPGRPAPPPRAQGRRRRQQCPHERPSTAPSQTTGR